MQSRKAFLIPKLHRVREFLMAQGVTMAGNLLFGLLCVRLLPKLEYAKFAVLFGFLGSLVVLLDIGISNTLAPLVGENIHDLQLIADYVASLRQVAHRLYAVMAPATMLIFPLIVWKQQWSWQVVSAMVAIILVAAWFARVSSAYGAVLLLRRDRKRWYTGQMISSLGNLAILGIFWAAHWLNIYTAILINVGGIVFISQFYFFRARRLLGVEGHPSKEKRRAIVHLAMPNSPSTIFYALQGQVSLLLITMFGHAAAVASIGALTRLSQIFTIFGQMNGVLVEPYFARLPRARLRANYLGGLAVVGCLCAALIALARFFPEIYLWVLGPKYANLRFEVMLIMIGGSIRYTSGVMWVIHSSRRFVYWWNNWLIVILTLLVQAVFLWKSDLSTVRNVLIFNIASALASLVACIVCGFYGFLKGPRKVEGTG
jgi:O-antigen/teichoic acid export membrane protein